MRAEIQNYINQTKLFESVDKEIPEIIRLQALKDFTDKLPEAGKHFKVHCH